MSLIKVCWIDCSQSVGSELVGSELVERSIADCQMVGSR